MALGNLRLAPGPREALAGAVYQWRVLGEKEAAVLAAVMERMMRGDDPELPPVRQTKAVETADWALAYAAEEQQVQFRWLLRLFQWSPPLRIRIGAYRLGSKVLSVGCIWGFGLSRT
mgnify:CR=1 FL=1